MSTPFSFTIISLYIIRIAFCFFGVALPGVLLHPIKNNGRYRTVRRLKNPLFKPLPRQNVLYCYIRLYGAFADFKYLCGGSHGCARVQNVFAEYFRPVLRGVFHIINSPKRALNTRKN